MKNWNNFIEFYLKIDWGLAKRSKSFMITLFVVVFVEIVAHYLFIRELFGWA